MAGAFGAGEMWGSRECTTQCNPVVFTPPSTPSNTINTIINNQQPQNVLLDAAGRAKIADFGISRFKDPARSYLSVTHAGGTPNYMCACVFAVGVCSW